MTRALEMVAADLRILGFEQKVLTACAVLSSILCITYLLFVPVRILLSFCVAVLLYFRI